MKRTPIKRKTSLKSAGSRIKRVRMRQVSVKRSREMKIYAKLRKELLSQFPACQVCGKRKSTDCHHKSKRGKNYLNVETFMAVCRSCHDRIHANPKWARENGLLI